MAYSPSYQRQKGRGVANGGFTPTHAYNFIPGILNGAVVMNAFDPGQGFNDVNDGGFHYFRIEEVKTMRYPTFRRVGIIYRDLGIATIQVALSAVDDNGQVNTNAVAGVYPSFTIGTKLATGRLCQKFLDTVITGMLPQMGIIRAANAGPVSISKMWLTTEVEEVTY